MTLCIRGLVRLLQRILLRAVIGIAFEVLFIGVDYWRQDDKRLYPVDHKTSIYTLIPLGSLIGAAIGIGWAVVSKARDADGKNPATPPSEVEV